MVRARCATAMDAVATAAQAIPLLGLVMLDIFLTQECVRHARQASTGRQQEMVHALIVPATTLDAALHLLVFAMQASAAQMVV